MICLWFSGIYKNGRKQNNVVNLCGSFVCKCFLRLLQTAPNMWVNPTKRLAELKNVKNALSNYAGKINDQKLRLTIEDVAVAGLDERMKTSLTSAEKARMKGTVRDLYDRLDSVDPSMMRSSGAFRTLKGKQQV